MSIAASSTKEIYASAPLGEVALQSIDLEDRALMITFAPRLEALRASIAKVGILHPPLLQATSPPGRYRVASGYKRIMVLKDLGAETVTAHLYPSGNDLALFSLGLAENLGTRPLNLVEKSLALDRLIHLFGLSREDVAQQHLPTLELGTDPETLDLYLSLASLEDDIKESLVRDRISIATAQRLAGLAPADRLAFHRLITDLVPGKNRQLQILTLLLDIVRIERAALSRLLEENEIQRLVHDQTVQTPVRARRVQEALHRRRYPRFSQAEQQFQELKKKLKLPAHVSLMPPPYFEDQTYRLTITFQSQKQLLAAQKALKDISDSSVLPELLNFALREEE